MTLLNEPRYSLDEAAEKLGVSRSTFNRYVRPKLRVICHSKRHIDVPESALEAYLQGQMTLGTPAEPTANPSKKTRAKR